MSGWISVKDRLPEPWVSVLVYMPEEYPCQTVHQGYLSPVGWVYWKSPAEITHWMPMPEGPEEDEKGELR